MFGKGAWNGPEKSSNGKWTVWDTGTLAWPFWPFWWMESKEMMDSKSQPATNLNHFSLYDSNLMPWMLLRKSRRFVWIFGVSAIFPWHGPTPAEAELNISRWTLLLECYNSPVALAPCRRNEYIIWKSCRKHKTRVLLWSSLGRASCGRSLGLML